jgi:hypothetical protein
METFKVVSFYDTETTNIKIGDVWHAYPILYIHDRITCDIADYRIGKDDIDFSRTDDGFFRRLEEDIEQGIAGGYIPICCAYNLAFDLQPILERLSRAYQIETMARTPTSIYTLDLVENGHKVLRFWDTSFLEPRGLAAMGKSCGIKKAVGDWDYSLVRTPKTELTTEELGYAKRDVQVIAAYLASILKSYPDIDPEELGSRVLTKTSLVRVTAREQIGKLKENGKPLNDVWMRTCEIERAKTYTEHAARMACFRGGLTFTSANNACKVFENCASFDTVSMHHLFINGRYVPRVMRAIEPTNALKVLEKVRDTSLEQVLDRYHNPFGCAFHAHVFCQNVRLKKGSVFEREGIGLLARSKFTSTSHKVAAPREASADSALREDGYRDRAFKVAFAFGKLMSCEECSLWVSELEFWCMSQVYDFDLVGCDYCEYTSTMTPPPAYVSLQSSMLYDLKSNCKEILERYHEGEPYEHYINPAMVNGYIAALKDGTQSTEDLASYYRDHVKGMFNGIYGTQAMNELKPDFVADCDGELVLDRKTVLTPENFDARKPYRSKVFYQYGLRIVGGSRMHLIIALMLIGDGLKDRVHILGGDTDSIKLSLAPGVTVENFVEKLKPLHDAVDLAMCESQKVIRKTYPELASTFDRVGYFECDGVYDLETDLWNKCRVTYRKDKGFKVVCAGLRQTDGMNIATVLQRYADRFGVAAAMQLFGYETELSYSVCKNLMHSKPKTTDVLDFDVTDYQGNTEHVCAHESVALYGSSKVFGSIEAQVNYESWLWMYRHGTKVRDTRRVVSYDEKDGKIVIRDKDGVITL